MNSPAHLPAGKAEKLVRQLANSFVAALSRKMRDGGSPDVHRDRLAADEIKFSVFLFVIFCL